MLKLVVFASGRGSNAKNIFELAKQNPDLVSITALISNSSTAGVLKIADHFEIPKFIIPVTRHATRRETRLKHESKIHSCLSRLEWDYICLAGYMRIFTEDFVTQYPHPKWPTSKIINIHPSLLPSFKGNSGYEDAYNYGVTVAGVSTHFVSTEVDAGPIIYQRYFKRMADDTLETFKHRGLIEEHICYRKSLLALANKTHTVHSNPFHIFLK
jgi:formyltetrahydrofolate-dependent phosphoribosylglycinamide formyltransferase